MKIRKVCEACGMDYKGSPDELDPEHFEQCEHCSWPNPIGDR